MKKRLAAVLAAMMVLAMSTTVFAAGSTTTTTATNTKVDATAAAAVANVNGVECFAPGVTVSSAPVESATTVANAQVAAKSVDSAATTLAVMEIKADKIPAGGIDINIGVAGIKPGDNILVLHWTGSIWEQITPSAVSDNVICAHFNSLSPVAIVKLPDVTTTATETTPAAPTSPKTGATAPILAVLAMISLAGVAVCGRKVKFN